MKIFYTILVIAVIALVGAVIGFNLNQPSEQPLIGSVGGSPYNATSTYSGMPWADILLQTGYGTLGSFIVLGADTTQFNILNATTTCTTVGKAGCNSARAATSSILMVSVPSSAAAGTYVYDAVFTDGLYVDVLAAGVGTTSLTWK